MIGNESRIETWVLNSSSSNKRHFVPVISNFWISVSFSAKWTGKLSKCWLLLFGMSLARVLGLLFSQDGLNQVVSKWTSWGLLSCGFCLPRNHLLSCALKNFWDCSPSATPVWFYEGCLHPWSACYVAAFLKTIIVSGLWVFKFLWKFMPLSVRLESTNIFNLFT